MSPDGLDGVVADVLARSEYRFTVADDDAERAVAYRIRYRTVVERRWSGGHPGESETEHDRFDAGAIHVIGWAGEVPVATGRIVVPPGPLPTEQVWGITVPPRGAVADVGRMTVVPEHRGRGNDAFTALLAALYSEVRQRGYATACGVMSAPARALIRVLGAPVEVLGEERWYWGELRAPVRFTLGPPPEPGSR